MPLATRAAPPVAVRRWLVGVCLSLLVVAGCSGGSGSGEEPESVAQSETESASPTTPSPSPTTEPWEKRTKAGAVAFVKHWVDVFNEAGASGDTSELRGISAEQCTSCQQIADLIDETNSDGQSLESKGWRVQVVQGVSGQTDGPFDLAVRIRRTPQTVTGPNGKKTRYPGSTETYGTEIAWVDGTWLLNKFNQLT